MATQRISIANPFSFNPVTAEVTVAKPAVDCVVIVVSERQDNDKLIARALHIAQETGAELAVVYTYKSSATRFISELNLANQTGALSVAEQNAENYLRAIKHNLMAQYDNVKAHLFETTNAVSAIHSIAKDSQHPYILLPQSRRVLSVFTTSPIAQLRNLLGDVATIEEI